MDHGRLRSWVEDVCLSFMLPLRPHTCVTAEAQVYPGLRFPALFLPNKQAGMPSVREEKLKKEITICNYLVSFLCLIFNTGALSPSLTSVQEYTNPEPVRFPSFKMFVLGKYEISKQKHKK